MPKTKGKKKRKSSSAPKLEFVGASSAWSEETAILQFAPLHVGYELTAEKVDPVGELVQWNVYRSRK